MNNLNYPIQNSPTIIGSGLIVLDIILNNGSKKPIFYAGGTTGNVLSGLSYLNWKSTSLFRVGSDIAAKILMSDLIKSGVDIKNISIENEISTPRVIEKLNSNGKYAKHKFLFQCPVCKLNLPRFRSPKIDCVGNFHSKNKNSTIFFFDRVSDSTLELARKYRESGSLIFFEPHHVKNTPKFNEAISLCHILKFSGKEKKQSINGNDFHSTMKKIRSLSSALIIKTIGEYGLYFSPYASKNYFYKDCFKLNKIYDSCGAGDWCTVGFLFHLWNLNKNSNFVLTESIKNWKIINNALNFGQILASFSSLFIGARGLSSFINNKDIIEAVHSNLESKKQIHISKQFMEKYPEKIKLKSKIEAKENNLCPICLQS